MSNLTTATVLILAFIVLILGCVVAGFAGYVIHDYRHLQEEGGRPIESLMADTSDLQIPPQMKIIAGAEPRVLRAETKGKRVMWMALDPEIVLWEQDLKSVRVFGLKPGQFRVIAWTSVGNLPTPNAVCLVTVVEQQNKDAERSSGQTTKRGGDDQ